MYIIVFKAHHREPHVAVSSNDFLERYCTKEDAIEEAERCKDNEWYFDYEIFEETD